MDNAKLESDFVSSHVLKRALLCVSTRPSYRPKILLKVIPSQPVSEN